MGGQAELSSLPISQPAIPVNTMASAALQWMVIRNNSAFLLKGSKHTFSKEPGNLKAQLVPLQWARARAHRGRRAVQGWQGRGACDQEARRAAQARAAAEPRRAQGRRAQDPTTIRKVIRGGRYRKDLKMAALRRASALLASQKPKPVKRVRGAKKKE